MLSTIYMHIYFMEKKLSHFNMLLMSAQHIIIMGVAQESE